MLAKSFDRPIFTVEEYFTIERNAVIRHEFYNGEIFAMAGGSIKHNRIKDDCCAAFNSILSPAGCESFTSDQRTETLRDEKYCYPDVVMVCGPIEISERWPDTIINPFCVVEVLSESTENFDRGKKLDSYKKIPSLSHCILVSQEKVLVEHHIKYDLSWMPTIYKHLSDNIIIKGKEIPLKHLYKRINF